MILDELRPASFRGVPFFFEAGTTTEGRSTAYYNYLNSGRRIQKDLGPFKPDFSITCFTKGLGNAYFTNRDALRTALSNPDPGVLVHPFLGTFTVKVGKYTFSERMSRLGVCSFDIPLRVVDADSAPVTPANRQATTSGIRGLATDASIALQAASAAVFSNSSPLNFTSSSSIISNVFDTFSDVLGPIGDTAAKITEYTGEALAVSEQASFYADNPTVLFATMADGILGVDGLTSDILAKYEAVKNLFGFGNADENTSVAVTSPIRINPDPKTNEDAERKNNAEVLSTFVQAQSLLEAYAQTGSYNFSTVNDIDRRNAELDAQFNIIANTITASPTQEVYDFTPYVADYSELYDNLKALRAASRDYLEQQSLNAAELETIDVAPIPASVLAYLLYDDSSRSDSIMDENGTRDNMALSGELQVLNK
jgi:prophage DNA circulation protein